MNNFKLSIIVFLLFLCILFFNYKTKVLSQEAIANNYNTISQEIEIVDNKITTLTSTTVGCPLLPAPSLLIA